MAATLRLRLRLSVRLRLSPRRKLHLVLLVLAEQPKGRISRGGRRGRRLFLLSPSADSFFLQKADVYATRPMDVNHGPSSTLAHAANPTDRAAPTTWGHVVIGQAGSGPFLLIVILPAVHPTLPLLLLRERLWGNVKNTQLPG